MLGKNKANGALKRRVEKKEREISQLTLCVISFRGQGTQVLFKTERMDAQALEKFQPKFLFSIETENFIIKTAQCVDDLKLALKLRHQVFLEETLNRTHESGLEFDSYDQKADHLLIIDKSQGFALGTYRLIHSDYSDIFYSQGEFNMDEFMNLEGAKLELGRACTHKDYRTGRTMDLLWQGLSRYIRDTKTMYLFGCSSLKTMEPEEVFKVIKSLQSKDAHTFELNIEPTPNYQFKDANSYLEKVEADPKILRTLPPLLRSYLHAGSQVYGYPALDEDFACSDLFTILDLLKLNKKFAERYKPVHPSLLASQSESE